jgi:hypothetical protein
MPSLSSFEQMLSYTGSKIAHMSEEFEKHHDKLSSTELKTMTAELKKSKKILSESFKDGIHPEFDSKLLFGIMSYINKIKKSTTSARAETTRKTQKMNFLEALADFQALLKTLKKQKKSSSENIYKKTGKKTVVKIQGIKGKSLSQVKELNNHLSLAESKLFELRKSCQIDQNFLTDAQSKDITSLLKKTNLYLAKTRELQKSFSGKAKPEYNKATLRKLLDHIQFLQNSLESEIQAGTAMVQTNLFWHTLREFQTLAQELEKLKKTRGKAVADVQTDLLS